MHLTRIIHILSWIQSWCISYLAYQHFSDKVPWKGSLIWERDVGKKKQTCNFIRDLNYVTIMVKPRWPLPSILECRKDYKCDSANVQRCFFMSSHSLFRRLQFAKAYHFVLHTCIHILMQPHNMLSAWFRLKNALLQLYTLCFPLWHPN